MSSPKILFQKQGIVKILCNDSVVLWEIGDSQNHYHYISKILRPFRGKRLQVTITALEPL